MKIIKVNFCGECPHMKLTGFHTKIIDQPRCGALRNKAIEYTTTHRAGQIHAIVSTIIPKYCPLENE